MVLGWLFDKLRGHCSGPRRDPKLAASQRSGVKRRSCCFRARLRGPPPNTGNSSQTFTPYRKLSIPTPYRIITIGCEFALSRCELAVKMEASIYAIYEFLYTLYTYTLAIYEFLFPEIR